MLCVSGIVLPLSVHNGLHVISKHGSPVAIAPIAFPLIHKLREASARNLSQKMRSAIFLLLLMVVVIRSGHSAKYKMYKVLPGRTERLVCLAHVPIANRTLPYVYFDWFYEGKRMNFSIKDHRRLDDNSRTLVIDNAREASQGRYECTCRWRKSGRPCYKYKTSKKTGLKKKTILQQRVALGLEEPEKMGFCRWMNNSYSPRQYKYDMSCKCIGGSDFVCGNKMKIQRQDRRSKNWIDVTFGFHYGAMSFIRSSNSMLISGRGANLTFEESGFYRCIAYDYEGILCQSDAVLIEPDFPPVPSHIPVFDEHLLWIGMPLVAIFFFVCSVVCGRLLYYRCTSRVIVKAKNSSLIRKYTPSDVESVGTESNSCSPHARSSASLYPDITVSS